MTNERIAEIKALYEAATPGPWSIEEEEFGTVIYPEVGGERRLRIADVRDFADAEFITSARQIIPELLEALELRDTWIKTCIRTGVMAIPEQYEKIDTIHRGGGGGKNE